MITTARAWATAAAQWRCGLNEGSLLDHTAQSFPVISGDDFVVKAGANLGDPLTEADELTLDDVYGLKRDARRARISVSALDETSGGAPFRLAPGTEIGTPGNRLFLDSALTFMSPDGSTLEGLVLVEIDEADLVCGCYLLPLNQLEARRDYALVAICRESVKAKLASLASVSFARGTRITLATGIQRPIEELRVGDQILTRDNGPREIRWIGHQTVRATGSAAPILIRAGVLNNLGDLIVSPNHRLFIWQRQDALRAGRSEVMVRAGQLVNGSSVVQTSGGFVDYFQLLFDQHEIIYAEGIAAESLLLDTRLRPTLPDEVLRRIRAQADPRAQFEIDDPASAAISADLLRQASG